MANRGRAPPRSIFMLFKDGRGVQIGGIGRRQRAGAGGERRTDRQASKEERQGGAHVRNCRLKFGFSLFKVFFWYVHKSKNPDPSNVPKDIAQWYDAHVFSAMALFSCNFFFYKIDNVVVSFIFDIVHVR